MRGAYMVQERKRAQDMGYKVNRKAFLVQFVKKSNMFISQDPICASKEETDKQYVTLRLATIQNSCTFMLSIPSLPAALLHVCAIHSSHDCDAVL